MSSFLSPQYMNGLSPGTGPPRGGSDGRPSGDWPQKLSEAPETGQAERAAALRIVEYFISLRLLRVLGPLSNQGRLTLYAAFLLWIKLQPATGVSVYTYVLMSRRLRPLWVGVRVIEMRKSK